jgi:hypothetical protein
MVVIPPTNVSIVTPHKKKFATGRQLVFTPGTAQQLSAIAITNGYPVTICALTGNTGNVYIGNSQAEVQDAQKRFDGLKAGVAIALKIQNLSEVWIDTDVASEGVSWIYETD